MNEAVPLIIGDPIDASLEEALATLREKEVFEFHILKLDQDLAPLLADLAPCICIFSVFDETSKRNAQLILNEIKKKVPANPNLRLIVMLREKMPGLDWNTFGVHEFIISPLPGKAIGYKLERHYNKFSEEPEELDASTVVETEQPKVWVISGQVPDPASREVIIVPRGKKMNSIESAPSEVSIPNKDLQSEKTEVVVPDFVIKATVPEIDDARGQWEQKPSVLKAKDAWRWKEKDSLNESTGQTFEFNGAKPVHDSTSNEWTFSGPKPELSKVDSDGQLRSILKVEKNETTTTLMMDPSVKVEEAKVVWNSGAPSSGAGNEERNFTGFLTDDTGSGTSVNSVDSILAELEAWKPKETGGGKEKSEKMPNLGLFTDEKQSEEKKAPIANSAEIDSKGNSAQRFENSPANSTSAASIESSTGSISANLVGQVQSSEPSLRSSEVYENQNSNDDGSSVGNFTGFFTGQDSDSPEFKVDPENKGKQTSDLSVSQEASSHSSAHFDQDQKSSEVPSVAVGSSVADSGVDAAATGSISSPEVTSELTSSVSEQGTSDFKSTGDEKSELLSTDSSTSDPVDAGVRERFDSDKDSEKSVSTFEKDNSQLAWSVRSGDKANLKRRKKGPGESDSDLTFEGEPSVSIVNDSTSNPASVTIDDLTKDLNHRPNLETVELSATGLALNSMATQEEEKLGWFPRVVRAVRKLFSKS